MSDLLDNMVEIVCSFGQGERKITPIVDTRFLLLASGILVIGLIVIFLV